MSTRSRHALDPTHPEHAPSGRANPGSRLLNPAAFRPLRRLGRTWLVLILLATAATSIRSATPPPIPPPSTLTALDAAIRATEAERSGDRGDAIARWSEASVLDPGAIPPRLALLRLYALTEPSRAAAEARGLAGIILTDYRASRWIVSHIVPGTAMALVLGSLLLLLGILVRHARALHHMMSEYLAWSLPAGRAAGPGAWCMLALPFVAGSGVAGTLLSWAFASSFRFSSRERILTLAATACILIAGPVLMAVRPLWGHAPDGRDASLIAEIQRDPASGPNSAALDAWLAAEPDGAAPNYLHALRASREGRIADALSRLATAAGRAELPPAVIETNLGTARLRAGFPAAAIEHYRRASAHDPACFEAQYNLGLVYAERSDYVAADAAMEEAATIDLERLRAIGRVAPGAVPRSPIEAELSAADLWSWQLRRAPAGTVPRPLLAILPLGHPVWSGPVLLLAVMIGLLVGGHLRRQPAPHVCFQCGAPICRRCLRRADRRAYCRACAGQVGTAGIGQSTRILLQRLIEERPSSWSRVRPWLEYLLPGVGCAVRGHPIAGAPSAILAGLALTLWTAPSWSHPLWILPTGAADATIAPRLALLLALAAMAANALGLRLAARRDGGLRAFFERDVDRLAA